MSDADQTVSAAHRKTPSARGICLTSVRDWLLSETFHHQPGSIPFHGNIVTVAPPLCYTGDMRISEAERDKYARIWQSGVYERSPGAEHVDLFLRLSGGQPCNTVIDIGAGDGQASRLLRERGLLVTAFDLTAAAWDNDDIPLTTGTIWNDLQRCEVHQFAYCCDVMEHIPEAFVALSVEKIRSVSSHAFFSVNFGPDMHGAMIGEPLHLTVRPFAWWRDLFRELGHLIEARDLLGEGVFYVA